MWFSRCFCTPHNRIPTPQGPVRSTSNSHVGETQKLRICTTLCSLTPPGGRKRRQLAKVWSLTTKTVSSPHINWSGRLPQCRFSPHIFTRTTRLELSAPLPCRSTLPKFHRPLCVATSVYGF